MKRPLIVCLSLLLVSFWGLTGFAADPNSLTIIQLGSENYFEVQQTGEGNQAYLDQDGTLNNVWASW